MSAPTWNVTLIAAVVAPVLMAASTIAYLVQGDGMNDGELGGAVMVWAMIAYAVAIVGLARLVEGSMPRAATVLTVVGLAGTAGGVGYGIDSIQVAVFGTESIQETTTAAAPIALQLPGTMFPLGLILLGVLLVRSGNVPAPAGYGLAVGAVLFPASRIPDVAGLAMVSDLVVLVALVATVAHLARSPRPAPAASLEGATT